MVADPTMWLLGLLGALIIVFTKIGGLLPGLTETPDIKTLEADLTDTTEQIKKLQQSLEQADNESKSYREDLKNGKIDQQKLEALTNSLHDQTARLTTSFDEQTKGKASIENNLRSQRNKEYYVAAVLYVVIGTILAGLFAKAQMDAIVIGAGWTSIVSLIQEKGNALKWDKVIDSTLQKSDSALQNASTQNTLALTRIN